MNKLKFKILVILMSLSLIGIVLLQLYWIKTSYENNDIQFQHHINRLLFNVSEKIKDQERYDFYKKLEEYRETTGKEPNKHNIKEIYYIEKDNRTNDEIVYSNIISLENFKLKGSFFDKTKDISIKNYSSKSRTEIFHGSQTGLDASNNLGNVATPSSSSKGTKADEIIEKDNDWDLFNRHSFDLALGEVVSNYPIEDRLSNEVLHKLLNQELKQFNVNTRFEYGVFYNGAITSIKSPNFKYTDNKTYSAPILQDFNHSTHYRLYVTFPEKSKFLFSDILPFTMLSLLFLLVIVAAYISALYQLIKQRQISEIKTDFINNMTHEFKTPIATINLALDAIQNPKIINDEEKIKRYSQMIRDENRRMHAQIENILRISKLEKRELDIPKERIEANDIIEAALEHVMLIIEDRGGKVHLDLNAKRTDILVSPTHFTSVLVNILDNAIKYSPESPNIEISTENIKDTILIKIKDHGSGMSKAAQKRIFEKFYREHTGDLHNVKGHGLGLAYVKQIIDDHNGQIFVESEKGKGSTFTIKLPLIT